MAGHMGDRRVTAQSLEVVATDADNGYLFVKGAIPGAKGGYVLVSDAVKRGLPADVPFPAGLKGGAAAPAAANEVKEEATSNEA